MFQYVGRKPSKDLKTVLNAPLMPEEEFTRSKISTFRSLFRDQVSLTIRNSGSIFRDGTYQHLASQHGAFDRLMEALEHSSFELVQVVRGSDERDEFLCRVQVRAAVMPGHNEEIFTEKLAADVKSFVLVSFYAGVCKDFIALMKKNDLAEGIFQTADAEKPAKDEAFDPENVIPSFIKTLRLERRYRYSLDKETVTPDQFYQSPEGFFYRIEVDGYAALDLGVEGKFR